MPFRMKAVYNGVYRNLKEKQRLSDQPERESSLIMRSVLFSCVFNQMSCFRDDEF